MPPAHPPESSASWSRDLLLLALATAVLFGIGLGSAPLANPDEGRYAEIPREMVARDDWVTPRLNEVVYFEKPPLVYWLTAGALLAFGPGEWSMRAVPALFALGGVLLTYAAGRRLYGRSAGLAAAGVLATSLLYFALAHVLLLDMALSVLMSATLFCFILGVRTPAEAAGPGARRFLNARRLLFYGLYASAALATLTKGLVGFLVTGAVMFFWLLIFNQWHRLRPFYLPTGSLLFLAIAAPWHGLAALRNDNWAHFYFVHEHWERFTLPDHGKGEPWWYFIPVLLVGIYPWTGFLFSAVSDAIRGNPASQGQGSSLRAGPFDGLRAGLFGGLRAGWAARKENADRWFLLLWAAFIFLFFSKSQSKIATYILPIFPALAVLIGAWLTHTVTLSAAAPGRLRWGLRAFSFVSGILALGMLVAIYRPDAIIKYPDQAIALRPYAMAALVILLTGGVLSPWMARVQGNRSALAGMGLTCGLFFMTLALATPHLMPAGTKTLALQVKSLAGPGDRVMHYHMFFQDFLFYAERPVDVVSYQGELELDEDPFARSSGRFMDEAEFRRVWAGPNRVFAVAQTNAVGALKVEPGFAFHQLGETRKHVLFSNRP